MKLGGNGSSDSLIVVRNLDKTYERGGEVIHVLQGLNLDVEKGDFVAFMAPSAYLAFAFRITPVLLALGIGFALVMGVLGGVPPAVRAARLPVAAALRDL